MGGLSRHVHLIWKPNTLSGQIPRYEADLPLDDDIIIDGDDVSLCAHKPWPGYGDNIDDLEDVSEESRALPLLTPDPEHNHTEKPSYKSELHNLLLAKGGPFILNILGRTEDGYLVFPKYPTDLFMFVLTKPSCRTESTFKRWLHEVVQGV